MICTIHFTFSTFCNHAPPCIPVLFFNSFALLLFTCRASAEEMRNAASAITPPSNLPHQQYPTGGVPIGSRANLVDSAQPIGSSNRFDSGVWQLSIDPRYLLKRVVLATKIFPRNRWRSKKCQIVDWYYILLSSCVPQQDSWVQNLIDVWNSQMMKCVKISQILKNLVACYIIYLLSRLS